MIGKILSAFRELQRKSKKNKEERESRWESHFDGRYALDVMLVKVGQEFEDEVRFKNAAKDVASRLPFADAARFTKYFHNTPSEPESLKSKTAKYGRFGVWMNICQSAIFEIFYNYREQAIPTLYSIAFGEYDWTQYKAIDVLCRLASDGVETDKIIAAIGAKIQSFRYEATMPSIESLAWVPNNEQVPPIILGVFDEYSNDDPIDGLNILSLLAVNYPKEAIPKLPFIKSLARGEGLSNRSPLLDGAILSYNTDGKKSYVIDGEEITGTFEETHRINATVLYFRLDPTDQEINNLLDFWEKNAESEDVRKQIRDLRKKEGRP